MKTKKYQEFITEMAQITKKGTKLTVDGTPLKNIKTSDIDDNIMFWRNDKANFMFEEGFSMLWFLDDDAYKKDFNGDNLLFFPRGGFSFDASPITDIWKKNKPIQKHIIGCIQADTSENQIFVDMMSVRSGYMKNGINKHMINALVSIFPNAVLKFSKPTKMGQEFINKYYPTAKIEGILTKEDLIDIYAVKKV